MKRIYRVNLETATETELNELRQQYMKNPMSLLEVDENDAKHLDEKIDIFLQYAHNYGFGGYVIGLSGGLDSSLCVILAAEAIGKENVYGMLLPSKFTSEEDIEDALEAAEMIGVGVNDYLKVRDNFDEVIGQTMMMTEIPKGHPKWKLMAANNHARERMKILRGRAMSLNYIVLGTTNLTEAWLGYATIAGDAYHGVDIEPIKQLPKTSERMYARIKGVSENVLKKSPSAGLWDGQTDESELSESVGKKVTYELIDRIMAGLMLGLSEEDIIKANNQKEIMLETILGLKAIAKKNEFKGKPEPFADLSG
ncbi:MAG: NAD(+) synthase [Nanoarchaeota archaeon]|nr:NAD(+) synthase [Nanoarchaeota archaeon]